MKCPQCGEYPEDCSCASAIVEALAEWFAGAAEPESNEDELRAVCERAAEYVRVRS